MRTLKFFFQPMMSTSSGCQSSRSCASLAMKSTAGPSPRRPLQSVTCLISSTPGVSASATALAAVTIASLCTQDRTGQDARAGRQA